MPIVLLRVDERLIHGQVVVGWGERLHTDRIIVVDDEIANSAWEQELYCLGIPPEIDAAFLDVATARDRLKQWADEPRRVILLIRDVTTLMKLGADGLLKGREVNLGGIHHASGRNRFLPYLFLSPVEVQQLKDLQGGGVTIAARDLPGSRDVALNNLRPQA